MSSTDLSSRSAATEVPINDLLTRRWSPRSFIENDTIPDNDLRALLEAARWAPSAQNRQPRRFVVGRKGTEQHTAIASAIPERNAIWALRAPLIIVGVVERLDAEGAVQRFAEYDLGQAIAHLSTQATHLGLHVRQMGGFDRPRLSEAVGIRPPLEPFIVVVVGRATPASELEPEFVRRDTAPRTRLPLSDLLIGGL